LRGACGKDIGLRQKVDEILKEHFAQDSLLAKAALEGAPTLDSGNEQFEGPGAMVGRYKILQQIGEGGMGAVYMAEQTEPVTRNVALKIIKLGLDTKQVVARFEAERQALAMMDHPSIAKVLDAGVTETGRPFFVMELVRGILITEYCDKNKLTARERLKLFIPVCHAIQHAHQKGVIHRDIKPSNVMVTLNPDGSGHPMVIDFGVAKATHQKLTEKTLFTNYAQMIGTPAYMSPEQAEMSHLDIDTRTDVYSLGVLLYELLTGTTPFPAKELMSKGYGEMQRILAEEEPPRPSNRYSTMTNEQRTVVARNCRMEVSAVSKIFRGDLDWIVMMCLEKDRARRYDTVNGIALDVQRHLDNDLVQARPPSLGYRFQKAWNRNKLGIAAAVAVAVSLVLGIAMSTWQTLKARAAKVEALESLETAKISRIAETEAKDLAKRKLYESLIGEAEAMQFAGRPHYRTNVVNLLQQALIEGGEKADRLKLRNIAVAALGDFNAIEYRTITNSIPNSEFACRRRRAGMEYAIGYENGSIEILDLRTGASSASLQGGHQAPIHSMLKLSEKDCWVTADVDSNIVVWNYLSNLDQWRILKTISMPEFSDPPLLVESGEQVAIWAQGESSVFLWNPFGSEEMRSIELTVPITRLDPIEVPIKEDLPLQQNLWVNSGSGSFPIV
jgi:serine/threonine protein kinase